MRTRSTGLFILMLAVTALAGAALILLVPALTDPASTVQGWIPTTLGGLVVLGAIGGWSVRPDRAPPAGPRHPQA